MSEANEHEDTARLNWLERLLWSGHVGNGVALFPLKNRSGEKCIDLTDLGDQDGSDCGEEIAEGQTLRAAIDAARAEINLEVSK